MPLSSLAVRRWGTIGRMDPRRRLPGLLLAVVAAGLTAVIVTRVSAGAAPEPHDTTPIVIREPAAAPTEPTAKAKPRPTRTTAHTSDDDYTPTVPQPRTVEDDHSGKGRGGGGRGRDHPEDD
jgi:hypothetical protein